jgi:hypothetical protein
MHNACTINPKFDLSSLNLPDNPTDIERYGARSGIRHQPSWTENFA